MTDYSTDEVTIAVEGGVGRLRLNRPRAIHALTLDMCHAMTRALQAWRDDPAVRIVILDHADGRGFCAGGDIRVIAESGRGDGEYARRFFHDEYQLDHLIFTYVKPVIAFMDGITMGGGVGISQPARYRIATERTVYAMPETGIGLFTDVGGGWYLARMPGRTGPFIGLTGARLDGAETTALGITSHYIASDKLDGVKAELIADPARLEAILAAHAQTPPEARILANREKIDRLFASDRYEDILAALEADGSDWATKELATLRSKSPQTCKVSLRLIAQGRDHVDFAEEMRIEYRIAAHICQRHDFLEGVRALIVDKDNAPQWQPATPDGVTDHLVDQIFAPLAPDEEWQPLSA